MIDLLTCLFIYFFFIYVTIYSPQNYTAHLIDLTGASFHDNEI